jgi:hypothetical protein
LDAAMPCDAEARYWHGRRVMADPLPNSLHVGWEDVYPNDIDCQWVDITGVPAGNYLLKVAINTAGYLPESDYTNDTATVPVTIPSE